MCCAIVNSYPDAVVHYRFSDRNNTRYPEGFADELKKQIEYLADVKITQEEINYMKKRCYYLPDWFFNYLEGVHMDPNAFTIRQDNMGYLSLDFSGKWSTYVLYEVQVLAIISRLYYIMTGQDMKPEEYCDKYYNMTYSKAKKMLDNGCVFAEFGTRRRYSFEAQEEAVKACTDAYEDAMLTSGKFTGTSNVYLAMKYNLVPIGTMAHEFISCIAGMYGSPIEANYIAMKEWEHTYNGALGTYLYDTFGFNAFANNFSDKYARSFDGLRVDSGDNYEQYELIKELYKKHRVDYRTKMVMFSNALTTDEFIKLNEYVTNDGGKCAAGIGTHLTNDMSEWGIKPMNIVIKAVFVGITERRPMLPTCKFSNDEGKYIAGDEKIAEFWRYQLNYGK